MLLLLGVLVSYLTHLCSSVALVYNLSRTFTLHLYLEFDQVYPDLFSKLLLGFSLVWDDAPPPLRRPPSSQWVLLITPSAQSAKLNKGHGSD